MSWIISIVILIVIGISIWYMYFRKPKAVNISNVTIDMTQTVVDFLIHGTFDNVISNPTFYLLDLRGCNKTTNTSFDTFNIPKLVSYKALDTFFGFGDPIDLSKPIPISNFITIPANSKVIIGDGMITVNNTGGLPGIASKDVYYNPKDDWSFVYDSQHGISKDPNDSFLSDYASFLGKKICILSVQNINSEIWISHGIVSSIFNVIVFDMSRGNNSIVNGYQPPCPIFGKYDPSAKQLSVQLINNNGYQDTYVTASSFKTQFMFASFPIDNKSVPTNYPSFYINPVDGTFVLGQCNVSIHVLTTKDRKPINYTDYSYDGKVIKMKYSDSTYSSLAWFTPPVPNLLWGQNVVPNIVIKGTYIIFPSKPDSLSINGDLILHENTQFNIENNSSNYDNITDKLDVKGAGIYDIKNVTTLEWDPHYNLSIVNGIATTNATKIYGETDRDDMTAMYTIVPQSNLQLVYGTNAIPVTITRLREAVNLVTINPNANTYKYEFIADTFELKQKSTPTAVRCIIKPTVTPQTMNLTMSSHSNVSVKTNDTDITGDLKGDVIVKTSVPLVYNADKTGLQHRAVVYLTFPYSNPDTMQFVFDKSSHDGITGENFSLYNVTANVQQSASVTIDVGKASSFTALTKATLYYSNNISFDATVTSEDFTFALSMLSMADPWCIIKLDIQNDGFDIVPTEISSMKYNNMENGTAGSWSLFPYPDIPHGKLTLLYAIPSGAYTAKSTLNITLYGISKQPSSSCTMITPSYSASPYTIDLLIPFHGTQRFSIPIIGSIDIPSSGTWYGIPMYNKTPTGTTVIHDVWSTGNPISFNVDNVKFENATLSGDVINVNSNTSGGPFALYIDGGGCLANVSINVSKGPIPFDIASSANAFYTTRDDTIKVSVPVKYIRDATATILITPDAATDEPTYITFDSPNEQDVTLANEEDTMLNLIYKNPYPQSKKITRVIHTINRFYGWDNKTTITFDMVPDVDFGFDESWDGVATATVNQSKLIYIIPLQLNSTIFNLQYNSFQYSVNDILYPITSTDIIRPYSKNRIQVSHPSPGSLAFLGKIVPPPGMSSIGSRWSKGITIDQPSVPQVGIVEFYQYGNRIILSGLINDIILDILKAFFQEMKTFSDRIEITNNLRYPFILQLGDIFIPIWVDNLDDIFNLETTTKPTIPDTIIIDEGCITLKDGYIFYMFEIVYGDYNGIPTFTKTYTREPVTEYIPIPDSVLIIIPPNSSPIVIDQNELYK